MRKNQGFAHTLLPVLLLLVGVGVSLALVNQRTSFFNRAAGIPTSVPNPTTWGNAALVSKQTNNLNVTHSSSLNPEGNGYTVEAWVKSLNPEYRSEIINKPGAYHLYINGFQVLTGYQVDYGFSTYVNKDGNCLSRSKHYTKLLPNNPDKWFHIAGVIQGDGNIDIFIDGEKGTEKTDIFTSECLSSNSVEIGTGRSGIYDRLLIDEVRISSISRYTSNFKPLSRPFTTDADTVALWHFDPPGQCNAETNECYTPDSSGNNHRAKIIGSIQFVPSTIPYTPPPTHKACQNLTCATVNGEGPDACQQTTDCMPIISHLECRNNACTKVTGIGKDSCKINTDCAPVPNTPPTCKVYIYNAASNMVPPFGYKNPLSGGATLYSGKYYLYGLEIKNNSTTSALANIKVAISKKTGASEPIKIAQIDKGCTANSVAKTVDCSPATSLRPGQTAFVDAGHIVLVQTSSAKTTTTLYSVSTNLGTTSCAFAWKVAPSPSQPMPL